MKNGASPGAKINTVVKIPGRDSAGITEKIPSDRAKDGAVDQAKVAGVAGTSAPQAVTSKESRRKLWQKVAERVHGSQDGKVQVRDLHSIKTKRFNE